MMVAIGGGVTEPTAVPIPSIGDQLDARFGELQSRLIAVARSLAGPDLAEDIVQDAYLRARERTGQLRDPAAMDAWLTRIVVSTAYNHHRHRQGLLARLPLLWERRAEPAPDAGLDELIDALPARERTVVVLQHAYGYRLDEIARMVGTSHTNARTIAHRARRHLAAAWERAER
jgi:RNA polymerase sigma-70 factor (ECF subfamily)